MAYFGVGPAVDGKNTGLEHSQNSRMYPGGKVVDKNGRTIFDPSISLTDLLIGDGGGGSPDPDDGYEVTLRRGATEFDPNMLDILFPEGYIFPEGSSFDDPDGNTHRRTVYLGIFMAPGTTIPAGVNPALYIDTVYSGSVPSAFFEGFIVNEVTLSSGPGTEVENPLTVTLGRGSTSFVADGQWTNASGSYNNSWASSPVVLDAVAARGDKLAVQVFLFAREEHFGPSYETPVNSGVVYQVFPVEVENFDSSLYPAIP